MDNEFADLEAELRRLRPRPAGTYLEARLATVLESRNGTVAADELTGRGTRSRSGYATATSWTSWKWANWGVAAALIALMTIFSRVGPVEIAPITVVEPVAAVAATAGPEGPTLKPVTAGRTLLGSRVDGLVELADGSAAQRVRDYYVDTIVWQDPTGRSQLRWEVPRESVRFVGLATY